MIYRVIETQEFDIEAESAASAEALVRDGVSHSPELIAASRQFFVSGRDVMDESGQLCDIEGASA